MLAAAGGFSPGIWRRGIIIRPTASSTGAASPSAASTSTPGISWPPLAWLPVIVGLYTGAVENPPQNTKEDDAEDVCAPVRLARTEASSTQLWPPLLALVRENQPVLDAAAALEHVGVVGAAVALADDVGAAELELRGQGGGAGPLDVLLVVALALVDAAHQVDGVLGTYGLVGDAFELGDGGDAAVGGLAVTTEGHCGKAG